MQDKSTFESDGGCFAGTCSFAATYNRALTAAEVLDLYRNGVNYADKWGSQTSLISGTDSTFSGAGNWINGGSTLQTFDVNSTVAGKAYLLLKASGTSGFIQLSKTVTYHGARPRGL